jgi:peptidoglycan/LPS O-acetylase OafA/YrhL
MALGRPGRRLSTLPGLLTGWLWMNLSSLVRQPRRTRYFPGISDRNSEISRFEFDYFPQLDGFRGLAASLVVVGHLILFRVGSDAIASLGVMLFFVLSGFLITGLLINERARYGRIDLRAFYLRRVLRLAPALACFLLAVMILIRLGLIVDVPRYELIACVFYFRNIVGRSTSLAHLWSLSLEEQFYGLWPLLIGWVKSVRRMLIYAAILTALISIARMIAIESRHFDYNAGITYTRPWFRFDSILVGCCIALARAQGDAWARRLKSLAERLPAWLAWTALFGWTLWGERVSMPWYLTLQMLLAGLVLMQLVFAPTPALSLLFCSRMMVHAGKISYGLYLWQQLFTANPASHWGLLQRFPVNVIMPIAIAELSHHFVEAKFLKLKSRLAPSRHRNATMIEVKTSAREGTPR